MHSNQVDTGLQPSDPGVKISQWLFLDCNQHACKFSLVKQSMVAFIHAKQNSFSKTYYFSTQSSKADFPTKLTRWTKLTRQLTSPWSLGSILDKLKNEVEAKMPYVSTSTRCMLLLSAGLSDQDQTPKPKSTKTTRFTWQRKLKHFQLKSNFH